MASIFKFNGYAVCPDKEYDAQEFMAMLEVGLNNRDMYTGPLVTEARIFEWDDDLLINDINCPEEVFEMYFDGTFKIKEDDELSNTDSPDDIDCDTCDFKDDCEVYTGEYPKEETEESSNNDGNKEKEETEAKDTKEDDVSSIQIIIYDGTEDDNTESEFDFDDISYFKEKIQQFHEKKSIKDAMTIASILDALFMG